MPKTVETRVGVCYNDFKYCTKGETGMLISSVVPCYNEEESLPIFYKEASKIAQQMGISHGADFEFIFVDDGSKDRTLQIARELHRKDARVRYISFSRNFGKEAGIYAGLKAAKGDYVATMDADLQARPRCCRKCWSCCSPANMTARPPAARHAGVNRPFAAGLPKSFIRSSISSRIQRSWMEQETSA